MIRHHGTGLSVCRIDCFGQSQHAETKIADPDGLKAALAARFTSIGSVVAVRGGSKRK